MTDCEVYGFLLGDLDLDKTMQRDISDYIITDDSARSLIGELVQRNEAAKFHGHVIGFPQRKVTLSSHEESFETILCRPAISSYIEDGLVRRSILSFGVLKGFQIGRLYIRDTIKNVFLRPYKFVSLTIACSDEQKIYCASQADRLHFAIGMGSQTFERLAELVKLKQMCSAHIPALIWKAPSLNFSTIEACDRDYAGCTTISAYEEDSLDFGLDELTRASFGI